MLSNSIELLLGVNCGPPANALPMSGIEQEAEIDEQGQCTGRGVPIRRVGNNVISDLDIYRAANVLMDR